VLLPAVVGAGAHVDRRPRVQRRRFPHRDEPDAQGHRDRFPGLRTLDLENTVF
jgi:hypothetical protein